MIEHTTPSGNYLQFEQLASMEKLRHGVSLRGGNEGHWDFHGERNDRGEQLESYCSAIGVQARRPILVRQVHGNHIAVVDGVPGETLEADGICTATVNVPLMLLGADCPLLIVYDERQKAMGLAHAGWRGTVGLIAQELIKKMRECFHCKAGDLKAGIGPAICGGCYEVGDDVIEQAIAGWQGHSDCVYKGDNGGKWHFDMVRANHKQLLDMGLSENNIELSQCCTYEDKRLWSYRRDGVKAGRWGLLAELVD